jgi:hypothetical protein
VLTGFEISGSNTMLSYYALASCTQKVKLIGKDEQFIYTSDGGDVSLGGLVRHEGACFRGESGYKLKGISM